MTDPTEKMEPPADTSWATFENPNKPRIYPKRLVSARHRVDPMRPANPHKPPIGEYKYDTIGSDPHYYGQHRETPDRASLWGILLCVASVVSVVWVVVWGLWLS